MLKERQLNLNLRDQPMMVELHHQIQWQIQQLNNQPNAKDKLPVIEEEYGDKDNKVDFNKKQSKEMPSSNISKKSMKSPIFMTRTSEESSKISTNRVVVRINKIQTSKIYQAIYFIIYYWLALNDHFRLIFFGKEGDTPFLVFTMMFLGKPIYQIILFSFL